MDWELEYRQGQAKLVCYVFLLLAVLFRGELVAPMSSGFRNMLGCFPFGKLSDNTAQQKSHIVLKSPDSDGLANRTSVAPELDGPNLPFGAVIQRWDQI